MPKKKVYFSEEDAATLTQRYDASTVLTLLLELNQFLDENPDRKINWNELVKKTSTGISDAREYHALWRHLAYRHELPETFEDGAQPPDDDSDLECELEPLPPGVLPEAALEGKACAKVMIVSQRLRESAPSSSLIEAPLMINVPVLNQNDNSQLGSKNIIFPVVVQRQPLPTVSSSTEVSETKPSIGGTGDTLIKKKRKAWSEEEDMQLRAAVRRCGEGNWAMMAKGDNFPINRSATQLAQRWSILRKKDGSTNSGSITTSSKYTDEQLATRRSLSVALADKPFYTLAASGMTVPGAKCNRGPDPAVKTAAVAAGACVVSPSDTSSQLKAAQARNAIPESNSLMKSSIPAGSTTVPNVHSNVPHVSSGVTDTPVPSQSPIDCVTAPASCTSTENHQMAVNSNLDKGSQDLDQENSTNLPLDNEGEATLVRNTQRDETLEDKAVDSNMETTEKHQAAVDSNMYKEI